METLFDTLKKILQGEELSIDPGSEPWNSIKSFLWDCFPEGKFVGKLEKNFKIEDENTLSNNVIGSEKGPYKGLRFNIRVVVVEKKFTIQFVLLDAQSPEWVFVDRFPGLKSGAKNWLLYKFVGTQLLFSNETIPGSKSSVGRLPGGYFHGALNDTNPVLSFLNSLGINASSTDLFFHGGIKRLGLVKSPLPDLPPLPFINIRATLSGEGNKILGKFEYTNLYINFSSFPKYNKAACIWENEESIELGFDLVFKSASEKEAFYLPVSAQLKNFDELFVLSIDLENAVSAALEDLALSLSSEVHGILGQCLQIIFNDKNPLSETIKIKSFQLGINPNGKSLVSFVSFGVTISQAKPWSLIEGVLEVESLGLDVYIENLFNNPSLTLGLKGYALIAQKGVVMVGGSYTFGDSPGFEFVGQLLPNDSVDTPATVPFDLLEAIRHIAGEQDEVLTTEGLPKLIVKKLNFYGSTIKDAKSISAALELQGPWDFAIDDTFKIGLEDISASLEKKFGEKGETTFKIKATFLLGTIQFALTLSYEGAKKGWTFSAGTLAKTPISVGVWLGDLFKELGILEAEIPENLKNWQLDDVEFTVKSKPTLNWSFTIRSIFKLGKEDCVATVNLKIEKGKDNKGWAVAFTAEGNIGGHNYKLYLGKNKDTNLLLAAYDHDPKIKEEISFQEMISNWDADLANYVPDFRLALNDVFVAVLKDKPTPPEQGKNHILLGIDVSGKLDFSGLPLVGKLIPKDKPITFDDFHFYVASQPFEAKHMQEIQQTMPSEITFLGSAIGKGITVKGKLDFAGFKAVLDSKADLKLNEPTTAPTRTGAATDPNIKVVDNVSWLELKKNLGPLHFERIGFQYKNKFIWFYVDAALSLGGLTLSTSGLGVGLEPHPFKAKFDILGLGAQFKKGPIEISGAYLKREVEETIINPQDWPQYGDAIKDGKIRYDEYAGSMIIKTAAFSIGAIGAYADRPLSPSLFISAFLKAQLGGPPFFFVTGLSLAFGYNRILKVPTIDKIPKFPLVAQILDDGKDKPPKTAEQPKPSEESKSPTFADQLKTLDEYIPISPHGLFLAAGIRFTSFKILDGFALLAFVIGEHDLEIDVIGFASVSAPPKSLTGDKVTTIAFIELAILLRFDIARGFIGLNAQLTDKTYIISKDCKLTGGLAIWSWLWGDHSGDFVISLGGYHPKYKVPAHYPQVPRVGLNWKVSDKLSIKGGIYAAVVPSTFMAGLEFHAIFQTGNLKAWFDAHLHVLIAWAPYHYDIDLGIDMGVSYTFWLFGKHTIGVEISAALHIWGPEFSGTAHVKLYIVSFTVKFGAGATPIPEPIAWSEFSKGFLPESEKVLTLSAKSGLIREVELAEGKIWIMRAADFAVSVSTALPPQEINWFNNSQLTGLTLPEHGIAPMDIARLDLNTLEVSIQAKSPTAQNAGLSSHFEPTLIKKNVPSALWGTSVKNAPKENKDLIMDVPLGLDFTTIAPKMGPSIQGDVDKHIDSIAIGAWQIGTTYTLQEIDKPNFNAYYQAIAEQLNQNEVAQLVDLMVEPNWDQDLIELFQDVPYFGN